MRPSVIYYLVSIDVVIVRQPSYRRDRYFTLFTEAKTLERKVEFSSYKSTAAGYIKGYVKRRKNESTSVVVLRLDGSKEYGSNELLQFAADNGIRL